MLHKHGCIILDSRGKVISEGYNYSRTYKPTVKGLWSVHAEAAAVMKLPKNKLRGATIIVVRVNVKGQFVNSEPCNHKCKKMLIKLGVSTVYYSVTEH